MKSKDQQKLEEAYTSVFDKTVNRILSESQPTGSNSRKSTNLDLSAQDLHNPSMLKNTTRTSTTMTKQNAFLIYELLTNAGWIDNPEDNIGYTIDEEGEEVAKEQLDQVNSLIALINPLLSNPLDMIEYSF